MTNSVQNEQQLSESNSDDFNENVNFNGQTIDNSSTFEWEYHMRREMQEIISGVFLGPYASALKAKMDVLDTCGITHIICVRQEIESHWIRPNFPNRFQYMTLDIADTPTQNIIQHFPAVREFIDKCLSGNGKVLVHGNAGISRSAALVIAYVMEKMNLTLADAIRLVQKKRFCIFPNEGFRRQLIEYEPILKARGMECQISDHGKERAQKRGLEDDNENGDSSQQMDTSSS